MDIRLSIAAAALLASSGLTAAEPERDPNLAVVTAQPDENTISRRVRFDDLNLTTAQGAKQFHQRVGIAVRGVCLEATGPNPLDWAEYSCQRTAWRDARPQIAKVIEAAQLAALNGTASGPMSIRIAVARR
jgi:UrcA family protein